MSIKDGWPHRRRALSAKPLAFQQMKAPQVKVPEAALNCTSTHGQSETQVCGLLLRVPHSPFYCVLNIHGIKNIFEYKFKA
jgi:hypothetical protein